jgi:hypothetical protein
MDWEVLWTGKCYKLGSVINWAPRVISDTCVCECVCGGVKGVV